MTLRIDVDGPFHHRAALATLAAHAIPGAEHTDRAESTHSRLVRIDAIDVAVTVSFDDRGVTVRHDGPDDDPIENLVRRWLDLASVTTSVDALLCLDPRLLAVGPWRPGLRLIGYPDQFEAVASTIVGQQISVAAGRTLLGRLVETYGSARGALRSFPRPADIAARVRFHARPTSPRVIRTISVLESD